MFYQLSLQIKNDYYKTKLSLRRQLFHYAWKSNILLFLSAKKHINLICNPTLIERRKTWYFISNHIISFKQITSHLFSQTDQSTRLHIASYYSRPKRFSHNMIKQIFFAKNISYAVLNDPRFQPELEFPLTYRQYIGHFSYLGRVRIQWLTSILLPYSWAVLHRLAMDGVRLVFLPQFWN